MSTLMEPNFFSKKIQSLDSFYAIIVSEKDYALTIHVSVNTIQLAPKGKKKTCTMYISTIKNKLIP